MSSVRLGTDTETRKEVWIGDIARQSGFYILGKPGMGKSALMVNMADQDIAHGHGLFFLDPHGKALEELQKTSAALAQRQHITLFDLEEREYSFGINLLTCKDVTDIRARTDTHTKAYNVFFKLWEESWGPWLQLILENVLWAFIENQAYTLAEVPLFLNPRNEDFRNHIISNITYNQPVADFWRYEFFSRREQNQQERVDAALTRINSLLTHPYIRHIIGQQKTTIDFETVVSSQAVWLFRLYANLAEDIKKFAGTILISELLHAVRARREGARDQFCVFIDEFHNFASSEDMGTLVTEGRKFGLATTFAHVERYGQLSGNERLQGATLATVNKALFQETVKDAAEAAPEFASGADETKTRLGGELILSPRPVEDIWERGHTSPFVMEVRSRYFWIIDLLRTKPHEPYYVFNPATAKTTKGNGGTLHDTAFDNWDMYRATPDMIREGIGLLNAYFYAWMIHRPYTKRGSVPSVANEKQLDMFVAILESFAGIFGWRPTMEPYIPDDMKHLFVRRANEHADRAFRELVHEAQRRNYAREHDLHNWMRRNPFNDPSSRSPAEGYWGERPLPLLSLETMLQGKKPEPWTIADVPDAVTPRTCQAIRQQAIAYGFLQAELDQLIQWRPRALSSQEKAAYRALVKIVANMSADHATYEREQNRVYHRYTSIMSVDDMVAKFGPKHRDLPYEKIEPYLRLITERNVWQMTEMQHFIIRVINAMPLALDEHPVYVQSGEYDEAPRRERTQAEMVDIMTWELVNLPRFHAYVKLIAEERGQQIVKTHKIHTHPLPKETKSAEVAKRLETVTRRYCKTREAIEDEIRTRQSRWQRGSEPPPTRRRRE